MIVALLLAQAAVPAAAVPYPTPGPAAVALGTRLARAGSLAALLPLVAGKETEALVAVHPELSPAERERLRAIGRRTLDQGSERIAAAMGLAYARRLSPGDLRALVAAAESPAQRRQRAAMPAALAEGIGGLGTLDFKKDVAAAFCRETGRLCPAP